VQTTRQVKWLARGVKVTPTGDTALATSLWRAPNRVFPVAIAATRVGCPPVERTDSSSVRLFQTTQVSDLPGGPTLRASPNGSNCTNSSGRQLRVHRIRSRVLGTVVRSTQARQRCGAGSLRLSIATSFLYRRLVAVGPQVSRSRPSSSNLVSTRSHSVRPITSNPAGLCRRRSGPRVDRPLRPLPAHHGSLERAVTRPRALDRSKV
jgi:hypothetical protein